MSTDAIHIQLGEALKSHKAEYRISAIDHIHELESKIKWLHSEGLFDETFFQDRLTSFRFALTDEYSKAKSILVVAVPQPIVIINFSWKRSLYPVTLPPTYDQQTDNVIKNCLESILNPEGYSVFRARIPEKTLAVNSGLMQYGRNNIGYVPQKGSFHRPVVFYTDLQCINDQWGPPVIMDRCLRCKACINACPTKAIDEDRFLLHAERCITAHNERLIEIPDYIDSSMHHCLLGCMICQKVCPENRKFVDWVEIRGNFTEEETGSLLEGVPYEHLDSFTQKKLDRLCLTEDYYLVARNLGLLLN